MSSPQKPAHEKSSESPEPLIAKVADFCIFVSFGFSSFVCFPSSRSFAAPSILPRFDFFHALRSGSIWQCAGSVVAHEEGHLNRHLCLDYCFFLADGHCADLYRSHYWKRRYACLFFLSSSSFDAMFMSVWRMRPRMSSFLSTASIAFTHLRVLNSPNRVVSYLARARYIPMITGPTFLVVAPMGPHTHTQTHLFSMKASSYSGDGASPASAGSWETTWAPGLSTMDYFHT